jgi:hypothetical protein
MPPRGEIAIPHAQKYTLGAQCQRLQIAKAEAPYCKMQMRPRLMSDWRTSITRSSGRAGDEDQDRAGELGDIMPRLSDRQSVTFVEHGKVNAVQFATMPNQVIVMQISN